MFSHLAENCTFKKQPLDALREVFFFSKLKRMINDMHLETSVFTPSVLVITNDMAKCNMFFIQCIHQSM